MQFANKLVTLAPSLILTFLYGQTDAAPASNHVSNRQVGGAPLNGWCTMHIVQYQKNEPGPPMTGADYLLNVTILGPGPNPRFLGNVDLGVSPVTVISYLMSSLTVTAGQVDSDAILFDYQDQHWGSNDQEHYSNFGGYDGGFRQGDTGFTC